MTSNAIFRGGSLPSWVKRFGSVREATNYANYIITEHRKETVFHIGVDPLDLDKFFYLIVPIEITDVKHHDWLTSNGFYVIVRA